MQVAHLFVFHPIEKVTDLNGTFYVIENYPYPAFVMDEDGNIKSFDGYQKAATEAEDCQEGYVIQF